MPVRMLDIRNGVMPVRGPCSRNLRVIDPADILPAWSDIMRGIGTVFRALVMPLTLAWPALLVLAWPFSLTAQLGDYSKIDALRYTVVPRGIVGGHAIPAAQGCNIAKMQAYLRTGLDGEPLSPQYVLILADELDGRGGAITRFHGISSPRLIWDLLSREGAPPQSLCTTLFTNITPTMTTAAQPYRVGGLVGYETLGTYQLAISHIAQHPGSALLLSTDGYDTRVVVGIKGGESVWLEYPAAGLPAVALRTESEGAQVWHDQLFGQLYGPENYMVVIEPR